MFLSGAGAGCKILHGNRRDLLRRVEVVSIAANCLALLIVLFSAILVLFIMITSSGNACWVGRVGASLCRGL